MSENAVHRKMRLLIIEDNPGDVRLFQQPLLERRAGTLELHHVEDPEQAWQFLRRQGAYEGVPLPDLIVLDLNLPRKDGHSFLAELKQDPALSFIPVIVWSVSENPRDVRHAYELGANSYVQKPLTLDGIASAVKAFENFWLETATLPSPGPVGISRT